MPILTKKKRHSREIPGTPNDVGPPNHPYYSPIPLPFSNPLKYGNFVWVPILGRKIYKSSPQKLGIRRRPWADSKRERKAKDQNVSLECANCTTATKLTFLWQACKQSLGGTTKNTGVPVLVEHGHPGNFGIPNTVEEPYPKGSKGISFEQQKISSRSF